MTSRTLTLVAGQENYYTFPLSIGADKTIISVVIAYDDAELGLPILGYAVQPSNDSIKALIRNRTSASITKAINFNVYYK